MPGHPATYTGAKAQIWPMTAYRYPKTALVSIFPSYCFVNMVLHPCVMTYIVCRLGSLIPLASFQVKSHVPAPNVQFALVHSFRWRCFQRSKLS